MKTPHMLFALILGTVLSGSAWALTNSAPTNTKAPLSGSPPSGTAVDRQVWRGAPIQVDLPLETEQIIRFPGATRLRSGLLGGPVPGLRIQVLDNHLYLLAKEPFASTRMIVQTGNGPAVLLDLAADARFASVGTREILTARADTSAAAGSESDVDAGAGAYMQEPVEKPVGYVALVRHAAQSLYAPPRLIPRAAAIYRAPLPDRGPVALVRGAHILATPVASWRAEGSQGPLWVTAVKLRNLLTRPVILDPRELRGRWQAASFQHARLGAAGEETDTTTVYLISDRRFSKSIRPWQSAHREGDTP